MLTCQVVTNPASTAWPQFFVTRASIVTTSNTVRAFNDLKAALEQYVSNSEDDTGYTNVKWTLKIDERLLPDDEVSLNCTIYYIMWILIVFSDTVDRTPVKLGFNIEY